MKKKSYFYIAFTIISVLITITQIHAQERKTVQDFLSNLSTTSPYVVAHRGASSLAPENTLASIQKAIELGADLIEIDVHLTKDKHLVVIHDKNVGRTTNGTGRVKRFTLNELKQFDASYKFYKEYPGEKIPTLREVLMLCKNQVPLLIELKAQRTEAPTINLIREMEMENQVILQSFNHEQMKLVSGLAPEIPTMILLRRPLFESEPDKAARWIIRRAITHGASGVAINYSWHTDQFEELAKEEKIALFVWTVNSKLSLKHFAQGNIKGIITNKPQTLIPLLDR